MLRVLAGCLLACLASVTLVDPAAAGAPPSPARVKVAKDLSRAHAAWPPGREWLRQNQKKTDGLVVPVLNRCLPDISGEEGEVTAFSIYLRVSRQGRILEVVADIDDELGRCMTRESQEVQLPAAPRDDFWIQVNLAAEL